MLNQVQHDGRGGYDGSMKLYYAPGACSQAPHIILNETGLPYDRVRVDLETKRTETGADYLAIAPKGAVPALELDDSQLLTENAVVLQYIADQAPGWHLIPPYGTMERYRVLEWLNYIATELHKGFAPLFHPTGELRAHAMDGLAAKFDYVESQLGLGPWLVGDSFGIADAYLFVILGWARVFHFDFVRWPGLKAFRQRVAERPAVRAALHAEGLAP
jgi:glutathione S-transferase